MFITLQPFIFKRIPFNVKAKSRNKLYYPHRFTKVSKATFEGYGVDPRIDISKIPEQIKKYIEGIEASAQKYLRKKQNVESENLGIGYYIEKSCDNEYQIFYSNTQDPGNPFIMTSLFDTKGNLLERVLKSNKKLITSVWTPDKKQHNTVVENAYGTLEKIIAWQRTLQGIEVRSQNFVDYKVTSGRNIFVNDAIKEVVDYDKTGQTKMTTEKGLTTVTKSDKIDRSTRKMLF